MGVLMKNGIAYSGEGSNLPPVTAADEGKVLTVDSDGKWDAEDVPKELPTVTSVDEGKVLTVDSNGNWITGEVSSGHNYSTTEQVVGTWINNKPVYEISNTKHVKGNAGNDINIQAIANLDKIISCDVSVPSGNMVWCFPLVSQSIGYKNGYLFFNDPSSRWDNDLLYTVRYTKTTD